MSEPGEHDAVPTIVEKSLETAVDANVHAGQMGEDSTVYPTGLKLVLLMSGLFLGVFVVSLVSSNTALRGLAVGAQI
jgi:hypothetical protein